MHMPLHIQESLLHEQGKIVVGTIRIEERSKISVSKHLYVELFNVMAILAPSLDASWKADPR